MAPGFFLENISPFILHGPRNRFSLEGIGCMQWPVRVMQHGASEKHHVGAAVGDDVYVSSAEYRFPIPRALPIMREPLQMPLIGDFRAGPKTQPAESCK